MPSLPDVTQEFTANVEPYIKALAEAAAAAKAFAAEAEKAGKAAAALGVAAQAAAQLLETLQRGEELLAASSATLAAVLKETSDSLGTLDHSFLSTALAADLLKQILEELRTATMFLSAMTSLLADSVRRAGDAMMGAAAKAALARLMMTYFGDSAVATAGKVAAGTGRMSATILAWWKQWSQVVHWVVMGALEILGTALPALVMFGLTLGAMYPTADHLYDSMHQLYIATGSLGGVFANSVPSLQQFSAHMGTLTNNVKPDVYIIFGAAINAMGTSFSLLTPMIQQAANMLAQFATKLGQSIQNSGGLLHKFFQDAVRDMQQWGQVLGNLASFVIHAFADMLGVGRVLLSFFEVFTRILSALASNPVTGTLLGIAAAMSAVYRYGRLLVGIWNFMGGAALSSALAPLVKNMLNAVSATGKWSSALTVLKGELLTTAVATKLLLGLTIALAAIAIWAAFQKVSDATDQLIQKIQAASPTVANLTNGFNTLGRNAVELTVRQTALTNTFRQTGGQIQTMGSAVHIYSSALDNNTQDIQKNTNAMRQQAQELLNLDVGLAEAGIRTGQLGQYQRVQAVMASTALKNMQSLNQAIDQYVSLLTGGMGAVAAFATGLNQLGQIAASTSNSLTTASGNLNLSAGQFSQALSSMDAKGAAAWTNLTTLINGSMQQTADWFRQASSLGAASSHTVNTAILSMVGSISKYIGSNKTAQAMALGWARSNGVVASSYPALLAQVKAAHGGMGNLTKATEATTVAMANLSQMAKNVQTSLNSQVNSALAASAMQSSGFNAALAKLQADMMNHQPPSVIQSDMNNVAAALLIAQKQATTLGTGVNTAMNTMANATHTSAGKVQSDAGQMKAHLAELQNQGFDQTASKAATDMGKVNSTTHSNFSAAGSAADAFKGKLQTLQGFINSMHGTNIVIHYSIVTSGSAPTGPGGQVPYHGAVYGYQGGGYIGSGMGGMDRVPAMLTVGEAVLTKAATAAMGGPLGIRNLNDNPHLGLDTTFGGRGGGGVINLTIISPVQVDGHTISTSQRTQTLIYNRRNIGNNLTLRNR